MTGKRGRPIKGQGSTVISVSLPNEIVNELRRDGVSPSATIRRLLAENMDRISPINMSSAEIIYFDEIVDTVDPPLRKALHKLIDKVLDDIIEKKRQSVGEIEVMDEGE